MVEGAGDGDDGIDDPSEPVVGPSDRGDERLVDLHLVHRQVAEPGQRRVAGAEVVDGDLHAELVEARHHLDRFVEAVQQGASR